MQIMQNLRNLKQVGGTYSKISVAHDLTPKQRETARELLEKAKKEYESLPEEPAVGNYRFIVVGAHKRPRVIKLKC